MNRVHELGEHFAGVARAEQSEGVTRFIASTSDEDRAGDVVAQDFELAEFAANPVILWAHNSSIPPVGRAVSHELGEALVLGVEWDDSDANPLGRTVAHQYRNGFLSAGSVGFRSERALVRSALPKDHGAYQKAKRGAYVGRYFEGNVLLEFSAVPIPMNPAALAVRAWATESGSPSEQLAKYLSETNTRTVAAQLLDAIERDASVRTALRAVLLTSSLTRTNERGIEHLFTKAEAADFGDLSHLWSPS